MMRHVIIFVVAAAIGGLLALLMRSAVHQPYAEPAPMPSSAEPHDHQPTTVPEAPASDPQKPAVAPHAGHTSETAKMPVNTICAICGMDVDPELPTTAFQGKTIGFACLKCPPKFAADPQRYGPAYLRNEKAP
jgi:hypothetical protein